MRALKILAVLGLLLAVSGTAGAVIVPTLPMGPTFLETKDADMGTGYTASWPTGSRRPW